MGTILIRCPETKSFVCTGVSMDHDTFFGDDLGAHELVCPDCGEIHRWAQSDAWIKDRPEAGTGSP
jgi:hypothetical protein